jgi:excisionase family DNA binding protein
VSRRLEAALHELAEALLEAARAELDTGPRAPDRLYSTDQAGAMLSLGRSLVFSEIASGRLGSVKVGRRRLIPADAIAAFIEARRDDAA